MVPKTYLPNYREFYEARQFTPGDTASCAEIQLAGQSTRRSAPASSSGSPSSRGLVLHVEICEDLWVPIAAVVLRRARRRDGAGQPLGVEHH